MSKVYKQMIPAPRFTKTAALLGAAVLSVPVFVLLTALERLLF